MAVGAAFWAILSSTCISFNIRHSFTKSDHCYCSYNNEIIECKFMFLFFNQFLSEIILRLKKLDLKVLISCCFGNPAAAGGTKSLEEFGVGILSALSPCSKIWNFDRCSAREHGPLRGHVVTHEARRIAPLFVFTFQHFQDSELIFWGNFTFANGNLTISRKFLENCPF